MLHQPDPDKTAEARLHFDIVASSSRQAASAWLDDARLFPRQTPSRGAPFAPFD
jgi:hypothetical protein